MSKKYTPFQRSFTNSKIIFDQDEIWKKINSAESFSEKTTAFCEGVHCPVIAINKGNLRRSSNMGKCKIDRREVIVNQSVCPFLSKER